MFQIQSESNLNEQIKYNIIDEDEKQNIQYKKIKPINYSDYLQLKEAYLSTQETWQKTKEENDQLNIILTSYQEEILKFNDYKHKIDKSFEIIQNKYNELYNENKSLKNNYNDNATKFNEIINELNNEIKQYELEISEKNNEIDRLKYVKNEFNLKNEELLKKKEKYLNEKEEAIKNKELDITKREKSLNQKELDIKEKETLLKLKENKLKLEIKEYEEKNEKLNEEISLKEKQINLDNNKINENKILINEAFDKIKAKEIFLEKELSKIKEIRKNILKTKEINIEYKYTKKLNKKYSIDCKDKFTICKNENKNIKIIHKEPEIQTFNNRSDLKLNMINNALLDNYLNTINIGYNNFKNNFNESLEEVNNIDNECEPIPSFLLCLNKNKE